MNGAQCGFAAFPFPEHLKCKAFFMFEGTTRRKEELLPALGHVLGLVDQCRWCRGLWLGQILIDTWRTVVDVIDSKHFNNVNSSIGVADLLALREAVEGTQEAHTVEETDAGGGSTSLACSTQEICGTAG